MYKSCIFDLDGTLTNTLDSLTYSVNRTLEEMGLAAITRDQCRIFVGNGSRVLLEEALKASGDPKLQRIEEAMERYGRIFDENCTYMVKPYEGIREMLEGLRERGIHMAVLSNKPDKQAKHVVEEIFGKGVFQYVQGQKEGTPRKPDPQAALLIARKLGGTPQETIYIGDSEVDVLTGRAARMRTISVSWGFRNIEFLGIAGAEYIAYAPHEILELIDYWEQEEN